MKNIEEKETKKKKRNKPSRTSPKTAIIRSTVFGPM